MRHKAPEKEFYEFDAWSFSRLGGQINSTQVKFDFPRLAEDENILSCNIERWQVTGSLNEHFESVIQFEGSFVVELSCVVCAEGVLHNIDFNRFLILKVSEEQADAHDEDTVEENMDVVACPGAINLRDWLEDEILLACPMFPKHELCAQQNARSWQDENGLQCPEHDPHNNAADLLQEKVQHPFANLSDLLKSSKK